MAETHPQSCFVATTDSANESTTRERLQQHGFHDVVATSVGAIGILRAIHTVHASRTGSGVRQIVGVVAEPAPIRISANPLTPRETEVLSLVGRGSTSYDISERLGISRSTVANHKERIFNKLQAKNQAHAVARAVNLGLISPGRNLPGDPGGNALLREEDPRRAG